MCIYSWSLAKNAKIWTAKEEKLKVVVCVHIESSRAAERCVIYTHRVLDRVGERWSSNIICVNT